MTVHLKWHKHLHSSLETLALVNAVTWEVHAKNHSDSSTTTSFKPWML